MPNRQSIAQEVMTGDDRHAHKSRLLAGYTIYI
jgi:hypothetical protein